MAVGTLVGGDVGVLVGECVRLGGIDVFVDVSVAFGVLDGEGITVSVFDAVIDGVYVWLGGTRVNVGVLVAVAVFDAVTDGV